MIKLKFIFLPFFVFFFISCGKNDVSHNQTHFLLLLASSKAENKESEKTKKNNEEEEENKESKRIEKIIIGGSLFVGTSVFIQTTDNKLFVFGKNSSGQLGLGDTEDRTTPTEFTDDKINGKVKEVTIGGVSVFIQTTDNKLFVFGSNSFGQLGLGHWDSKETPVEVTKFSGKVKKVTASDGTTFVETMDDKLYAAGRNANGQLGLGDALTVVNQNSFVELKFFSGKVKKVTASDTTTFIETMNGELYAAGYNDSGQLGLNKTSNKEKTFELVNNATNGENISQKIEKIIATGDTTYIKTTDKKLFVFGSNNRGQLGLNLLTTEKVKTPRELTDFSGKVKEITVNDKLSVFVETTDKKLYAFGYNHVGQLGVGDQTDRKLPQEIMTRINSPVKKVTVDYDSTFIQTENNELYVFGRNHYGQLGLGNTDNQFSPVKITNNNISRKVEKTTVNLYSTFIETTDKKLYVFGKNTSGQLGLGNTRDQSSPFELVLPGYTQ